MNERLSNLEARLEFIERCREVGFPADRIRELVDSADPYRSMTDAELDCFAGETIGGVPWANVTDADLEAIAEGEPLEKVLRSYDGFDPSEVD